MNTHPKLLDKIEETLSTVRVANNHAAARYIEALVHHAFIAGCEIGYVHGEERTGDPNKEWEGYTGE